ncbi:MAG: alpha/beta fold hydrolase [Candidatus Pacebacteria bacterium]|nr:alpha/beta fold hydrolase [Candidatus Paceibacterota bacterium]
MNQTSFAPIFILHGWTLDPSTPSKWEPFINQLQQKGFEPTLLKIPGLSSELKQTWELADYQSWLKMVLPDRKVILLGHSFGGQLAASFTARFPEIVEQLILVDSAGVRQKKGLALIKTRVFKLLAKTGKLGVRLLSLGSNQLESKLEAVLRRLLYFLARERDYYQSPPELRQTLANVLQADIQDILSKISVPTLLIWGQEDKSTPLNDAMIFNNKIPQSRLEVIKDARHSPQYTQPELTASLVSDFLIKQESRSGGRREIERIEGAREGKVRDGEAKEGGAREGKVRDGEAKP